MGSEKGFELGQVEIRLPVAPTDAFPLARVDGRLTTHQAVACRKLLDGLQQKQARLRSGALVDRPFRVFQYALEAVAAQLAGAGVDAHRADGNASEARADGNPGFSDSRIFGS